MLQKGILCLFDYRGCLVLRTQKWEGPVVQKRGRQKSKNGLKPSFFVPERGKTGGEVNGMKGFWKNDGNEMTVEEILSLVEQGCEFIVKDGVLIQVPAK